MKKLFFLLLSLSALIANDLKEISLDEYLSNFDMEERSNMKIKTAEMLVMVEEGNAILIDIRSKKEFKSWSMGFAKNIPLNELPSRLNELPKDKLIITACPHNDRANIARIYLTTKGYKARYLNDGLLKVADYLRGDNAVEFQDELEKLKLKK